MKNCFLSTLFGILLLTSCSPKTTSIPVPQGNTIIVTSTSDSGTGTLRQALQDAQPYDTITFDPAIFPVNTPVTIFVSSELPHIIINNLTLDASQAGIILDGSQVTGEWVAGLQIVSSHSNAIRGLQIANFPGPGIAISGDAKNNVIGGDRKLGAGPYGQGNLLSNNAHGIDLSTSNTSLNTITGNLLGTDATHTEALGNQIGVWITEGAHDNIVGPDNIIAYNNGPGILVDDPNSRQNTITQNSIHNNSGKSIDLRGGGNLQLAAPIILNFNLSAGTAKGTTCSNCTVEIFSDKYDGGANIEGWTTADENGLFTFTKGAAFTGPNLTATTTDIDGNTSGFSLLSPETAVAAESPSIIFYNGTILTMEVDQPTAEAIAVADDIILAVGMNDDILALKVSGTRLVDLQGSTLMPGFADGHTHIMWILEDKTLDEVQDIVLGYGYTSVTEMTSMDGHLERLLQAEAEGSLRLRVNVFVSYNETHLDENGNMIPIQYWYPENGPVLDSERMLRIPGIKIFVDGSGVRGNGCPALREPYGDEYVLLDWFQNCGSAYGDLHWPNQADLNRVVADAQAAGYRVAFHAMGDKAIETALDAIEFALDGQPNSEIRHQIQHNSLLEQDLLERYLPEGILASVRGYFPTCDANGNEDQPSVNRYSLPGLGVHAYLETDAGWTKDPYDISRSSALNPLVQLWGLVTHQQLRADGTVCIPDPWIAEHNITVEKALRMMTYEPAYAVSQEQVLGSLVPGNYADLVILSGNPMTVDPNNLKDLEVRMTMVGGKVEYCAQGNEEICP